MFIYIKSQATFGAGRVDLLTFERAGVWLPGRTLQAEVERLDGFGYDCYYVGNKVLIKMTGKGCWRQSYGEMLEFSNILCARRAWALQRTLLSPFNLANRPRVLTLPTLL